MKRHISFPLIILFTLSYFLGTSCNFKSIEESVAFNTKDELWQAFRAKFPYHVQTIAKSLWQQDGSINLIVSEPPPSLFGISDLDYFIESQKSLFDSFSHSVKTKRNPIGVNGSVEDWIVTLRDISASQFEELIKHLSKKLFYTSYKAHVLDLSEFESTPLIYDLHYQISALELEQWFLEENEYFHELNKTQESYLLEDLLLNDQYGVFYSTKPGFVVWLFSQEDGLSSYYNGFYNNNSDPINYKAHIRQFAIDSDLILGAIEKNNNIAIIGRERETSIYSLPPLRTETVIDLAKANNEEISQSYERTHIFAGKLTGGKDWAPIYLSPELIDTEYGSLLNITDQLLKSWSLNGETEYENFGYPLPPRWPFRTNLFDLLGSEYITFNWNTSGAAYVVEQDDFSIVALNRTGSLPISYFPEGMESDEEDLETTRKYENQAYDYFSSLSDPNLVRAAQYAALYQIFSYYDVPPDGSTTKSSQTANLNSVLFKHLANGMDALMNITPDAVVSYADSIAQAYEGDEIDYVLLVAQDLFYLLGDMKAVSEEFTYKYGSDNNGPYGLFIDFIINDYGGESIEIFNSKAEYDTRNYLANAGYDRFSYRGYEVPLSRMYTTLEKDQAFEEANKIIDDISLYSADFRSLVSDLAKYYGTDGLDFLEINKDKIYEEYSSIEPSNYYTPIIKTPTVVLSWSVDSTLVVGGHNIRSSVTPFKVDKSLKPGQYNVKYINGKKYVFVAQGDLNKITPKFLRNVETSSITGSKRFASSSIDNALLRTRNEVIPVQYKPTRGATLGEASISSTKLPKGRVLYGPSGKGYKTEKINGNNFIKDPSNPNLLYPESQLNNISAIKNNTSKTKFWHDEVEIASFVDDLSENVFLKHVSNSRYTKGYESFKSIDDIRNFMKAREKKTLITFGHIKNNTISCPYNRHNFNFKISEIEQVARETGTNVMIIGCNSCYAGSNVARSGTAGYINSIEYASTLGNAVRKSKNAFELFDNLANGKNKFIIASDATIRKLGYREGQIVKIVTITAAGVVTGASIWALAEAAEGED